MIFGIGSDLVDISRIDKTLKKFGNRFINRCFLFEISFFLIRGANGSNIDVG